MPLAIGLISLSTFIGGGFQMVALKVGSYAFPREQSAMMSGIASGSWSLVNFILLQAIGPRSNLMNNQQWETIFWIIALLPAVGIAVWLVLSRNQTTVRARDASRRAVNQYASLSMNIDLNGPSNNVPVLE